MHRIGTTPRQGYALANKNQDINTITFGDLSQRTVNRRRPKLMSNHKVVQKLFNIGGKENIGSQQLALSKPKPSVPVDTEQEMFVYLLARQKEEYEKMLERYGV